MTWKDQVVYQIFVDRFKRGPHFSQKLSKGIYFRDGGFVKEWNESPSKLSNGMEFFGGDLEGILEKLDYLKSLGVNVLYLTPIFLASTNHKYDTHDFVIDEQFGNEESLKILIEEAHKHEIKIILDGVFNHVGADGKWFNRSKKYGEGGAYNDKNSKFKDFFYFKKWPNDYSSWHDVKLLPELNLNNKKLRELLFSGKNSVIKRYLKLGIDGWRLDCAHDLGHDVNLLITKNVKEINPNAYVVGEISTYPKEWMKDGELDGVMNYYFTNIVIGGLKGLYPPSVVKMELDRMVKEIGVDKLSTSWNMLSSHDTPRLKNVLKDKNLIKMALTFQISYPGNPFIYYGEENGMEGGEDPDNRRPMIWDKEKWDKELRDHTIKAMRIKTTENALKGGGYTELSLPPTSSLIAFLRYTNIPQDTLFFFANLSSREVMEEIPIPFSYFMSHSLCVPILGRATAEAKVSSLKVIVPPHTASLLKCVSNFSTYKMYKYLYNSRDAWK